MKITAIPGKICRELAHAYEGLGRLVMRPLFAACGRNAVFFPASSHFSYKHVSLGNNVYIGPGAFMLAHLSCIRIGSNTAIGPHVTIIGGDHRFDQVGRTVNGFPPPDKLPENDLDVEIGDDVWIGCNVTILKGGDRCARYGGGGRGGGDEELSALFDFGRRAGPGHRAPFHRRTDRPARTGSV